LRFAALGRRQALFGDVLGRDRQGSFFLFLLTPFQQQVALQGLAHLGREFHGGELQESQGLAQLGGETESLALTQRESGFQTETLAYSEAWDLPVEYPLEPQGGRRRTRPMLGGV